MPKPNVCLEHLLKASSPRGNAMGTRKAEVVSNFITSEPLQKDGQRHYCNYLVTTEISAAPPSPSSAIQSVDVFYRANLGFRVAPWGP